MAVFSETGYIYLCIYTYIYKYLTQLDNTYPWRDDMRMLLFRTVYNTESWRHHSVHYCTGVMAQWNMADAYYGILMHTMEAIRFNEQELEKNAHNIFYKNA